MYVKALCFSNSVHLHTLKKNSKTHIKSFGQLVSHKLRLFHFELQKKHLREIYILYGLNEVCTVYQTVQNCIS